MANNLIKSIFHKLLGAMIDENITWGDRVQTVEKKVAKNLGLLYRAKHLLDNDSFETIYLPILHGEMHVLPSESYTLSATACCTTNI